MVKDQFMLTPRVGANDPEFYWFQIMKKSDPKVPIEDASWQDIKKSVKTADETFKANVAWAKKFGFVVA